MEFDYKELQLILKCMAFSVSGDVCWNQTDEELEAVRKLMVKFNGIKLPENMYSVKDFTEDEFTDIMVRDFGLRVK